EQADVPAVRLPLFQIKIGCAKRQSGEADRRSARDNDAAAIDVVDRDGGRRSARSGEAKRTGDDPSAVAIGANRPGAGSIGIRDGSRVFVRSRRWVGVGEGGDNAGEWHARIGTDISARARERSVSDIDGETCRAGADG